MPTSPVFDLPYPGPGDANNVPADIYALIARLEEVLVAQSSGVYTPAVAGATNVASATGHPSTWTRLGDVVTVTGRADITPTTNANTTFTVPLPVASNLGSTYDLSGVAVTGNAPLTPGTCVAETTADKATVRFVADNTTPNVISFHFAYRVLT